MAVSDDELDNVSLDEISDEAVVLSSQLPANKHVKHTLATCGSQD